MSNLDPQATPFVPAYTRMFYTGPIMPPHAVHGAPPPNAAYQSPGGDMKRTPLNPQAPAFVPGAGIGFRPGSTATFAHGRVQLPSHAFPPQQQVAAVENSASPPAALAYAEAAPPAENKEDSPAISRTETWASKVKKAVAAEAAPSSPAVAEGAPAASSPVTKDAAVVSSPKEPAKSKAAPKAARAKAGGKARASKPASASEPAKPTPKASTKGGVTKVSAKSSKTTDKVAAIQRDQVTPSPTAAGKSTVATSPVAKTLVKREKSMELEEKRANKKADERGSESAARGEACTEKTLVKPAEKAADKAVEKSVDSSPAERPQKAEAARSDAAAKMVEKSSPKVISKPVEKLASTRGETPAEKLAEKPVEKPVEKPAEEPADEQAAAEPTGKAKEATVAKSVEKAALEKTGVKGAIVSRAAKDSDIGISGGAVGKESSEIEQPLEDHSPPEAPSTMETKVISTDSGVATAPSEQADAKPSEKESPAEMVSSKQVVKRDGLHSARPSASSRVSALLGNADDDDVTRYQPLSSRTPFGLKTGGSYGLKQKLQFVVAGLGSYGSGGLDKLDAETKKEAPMPETTSSSIGVMDRGAATVGPELSAGNVPPTSSAASETQQLPSTGVAAASSGPSFTYTLSANKVKVYNLQDMLSIRHLPQCNKPQKPSSPSALFGMRNTVIGSSTAIFDIPSALGHKHRGLDRMLEEGSNSNWNLRASKDEPFRTSSHGGGAGSASDMSWIRRPAAEVPEVPKDSWQATQAAAKVKSDRNVKLQRKLKAQLNKMTPATYDDIFKAIMDLGIETIEEAQLCVNLVFEKAITNHQYIDMYARLCHDLQKRLESDGVFNPTSGSDFRRMLVQCCQTAFENNLQKPFVPPEGAEEEETFEALLLYKKKMKGNLVFVSALSMQHLVGARVLLSILTKLIDNKDSTQLEALAAFLPTVANSLEASKLKESFEEMFTQIRALSQDPEVEHRIRCLLLDCVEQRDKELRRSEHQQFRKVQSHMGGSGFHSVLPKTRTYQ